MLEINSLIKTPEFQLVINSDDFYFQKGTDALHKWLDLDVSDPIRMELIRLSSDYNEIQNAASNSKEIKEVLDLLFVIISYCDIKAKGKHIYNDYPNKRSLAGAAVRMNHWVEKLIQFKFNQDNVVTGSIRNALYYLLDPGNNATILSENHRELIAKNLLKKDFKSSSFVDDLKAFFSSYNLNTVNPKNYTRLLSNIIYSIEDEWKDEVVALMASDSTGWQDDYIEEMKDYKYGILWNSKRPSGTSETLKFLRNIVREGNSFNLYYSLGGQVKYVAIVNDFVENQDQLIKKNWGEQEEILYFNKNFEKYTDQNKSAKIVFLASKIEKVTPIPVSKFLFYKGYDVPRQDNLSPVKYEPKELESISIVKEDYKRGKENRITLNQILFGPPGTGKTFNTVNKALEIVNPSFKIEKNRKVVKEEYDKYVNNGQIVFTTFHQSMSYEDFVEGIKPQEPKEEGKPISYKIEEGIFRKICYKANPSYGNIESVIEEFKKEISEDDDKQPLTIKAKGTSFKVIYRGTSVFYVQPLASTKDKPWYPVNINNIYKAFETHNYDGIYNPTYVREIINFLQENRGLRKGSNQNQQNLPYVLIIDEINRGNVSQILGELITLIEEDKRLGRKEALEVTLPYSKEKFGVPSNLYIIGTMNTADRSVEALDTALRRRFTFREYMPDPKLIEKELGDKNIWNGIKLSDVLDTINKRIEVLLDRDHQIGHSYFLALDHSSDFEAELKNVFTQKIIPLLQEYFYNDYVKIGMVLGAGFVNAEKRDKITFAKISESLDSDYSDGYIYHLIPDEQIDLTAAIHMLLNQPKDAEKLDK